MAKENYLLKRARLIQIELETEYERVQGIHNSANHIEMTACMETLKQHMIDTEKGIKLLEEFNT